jgi:hypothetical protein
MKTGKNITELAQELTRIHETSKDFIVPTAQMEMTDELSLSFEGKTFAPNNWAHNQIATYTDIPKSYYDRIRKENAGLLALNINYGFCAAVLAASATRKESRMVRTVDGHARAFLSSRYRRLDGYDLLNNVYEDLTQNGLEVISSEITERKMYLKCTTPRITAEVKRGDVVQYGLVVSCSDVGAGAVNVEPLIYRLVCLNGMISNSALRKFHIGRDSGSDSVEELLTDGTKELNDKSFWATVRDVVRGSMRPEIFNVQVDRLREAAGMAIENFDLPHVVEMSMKRTGIIGENIKNNIVSYLANGADGAGLTKYGLSNAYTWAAQAEDATYEEATDLERAGGKIIELGKADWELINRKVA